MPRLIRFSFFSLLLPCAVLTGCSLFRAEDERDHDPEPLPPPLHPSPLATTTWDMCRLLGPKSERAGLYGSDLGYTAPLPGSNRLAMLFGDTWVTDLAPDERAVEVYWNVSTWNPYQVVLMKTQLRGSP